MYVDKENAIVKDFIKCGDEFVRTYQTVAVSDDTAAQSKQTVIVKDEQQQLNIVQLSQQSQIVSDIPTKVCQPEMNLLLVITTSRLRKRKKMIPITMPSYGYSSYHYQ